MSTKGVKHGALPEVASPRRVASAIPPSDSLQVAELRSLETFSALESEWNALVERTGAVPFARHENIDAWIRSFVPGAQLVILIGRDGLGQLVAALPLLLESGSLCGLPVRQLVSTANTHSSRFDLVALDPQLAARAFLEHLLKRKDWDVLRIIDVPEHGAGVQIQTAAIEWGLPVGTWESARSPYLAFPSSYEALLATKSPLFRANLRRRRRQLEKRGVLTVERVTGGESLAERLEEGFALEGRGWKGLEGSAMSQSAQTRAFYRAIAEGAARRGHLSLFFLRLDGAPIAFHFGLVHDRVYYVPKLAYDETLTKCSPGLVLLEEVIKDGIARGLVGYDFLGDEAEWKKKWSSSQRPSHWLFIFRKTIAGRVLRSAKFEWVPRLRRLFPRSRKTGHAA